MSYEVAEYISENIFKSLGSFSNQCVHFGICRLRIPVYQSQTSGWMPIQNTPYGKQVWTSEQCNQDRLPLQLHQPV